MDQAASLADQPAEMIGALREVFAFYADRTRRPSTVIHAADTVSSYDAPGPVIRQARRSLQLEFDRGGLAAEPLIEALWQAGDRELRLLAIPLFEALAWQEAVARAEQLLQDNRDPRVLQAFADTEYAAWLDGPDPTVLPLLARWLGMKNEQLPRLALLILLRRLDQASSDRLPAYFELLQGLAGTLPPQAQRALRRVVRKLAGWNPAEAAQFLLDEARRNNWKSPYRELIQDCLEAFPAAQRQEISAALMAQ
jgi:hypothetical protein